MKDLIITIRDFREIGVCPKSRYWFEKHGLDWRDFVKNGISLETLRATGDQQSNVDRVEAAARRRLNGR